MTKYLGGLKTLFLASVLILKFLKHIQPVPFWYSINGNSEQRFLESPDTSTKHYNQHIINKSDLVDFDFLTPVVSKFKDD